MGVRISAACSTASRSDGYERRRPEQTLLYQLVEQHWPTFRERAEQVGGLPKFVVDEFEVYLRCGILEHGLAHFPCGRCGAGGFNLSLLMRKLVGVGTPRSLQGGLVAFLQLIIMLVSALIELLRLNVRELGRRVTPLAWVS